MCWLSLFIEEQNKNPIIAKSPMSYTTFTYIMKAEVLMVVGRESEANEAYNWK
ncbi:MAG: hypothetical protein H6Q67_2014 [Firmicutes bacterium]|nr:hypothetical protein [Bacillota bacterium]